MSRTEAATEKGISFFTVDGLMVIGATIAAQPTMSMQFIVFEPTTLPTAKSGVPFRADTRLTKSSGAEVPAATMVRPMIISGTFILLASAAAPSVSLSAPNSTNATPRIIKRNQISSSLSSKSKSKSPYPSSEGPTNSSNARRSFFVGRPVPR